MKPLLRPRAALPRYLVRVRSPGAAEFIIGFSLLSASYAFSLCTLHFHFHFVLGFCMIDLCEMIGSEIGFVRSPKSIFNSKIEDRARAGGDQCAAARARGGAERALSPLRDCAYRTVSTAGVEIQQADGTHRVPCVRCVCCSVDGGGVHPGAQLP